MITSSSYERGAINPSTLTIIGLAVFTVVFAGMSVWAFINYMDQKNNVDAKVSTAVTEAEKKLGDKLEADFIERDKQPLKSFTGPSDYGTLGFKFPKTWSVYVSNDGSKGTGYEAFFNPGAVPSVDAASSRYALRIAIVNEQYETVIDGYANLVEKGTLKSSTTKANGETGTRLEGNFTKDIRGSAVIFKIRDKSVIVQSDADTFKDDFNALVATITFVQ
ncbi:hypothetical protein H7142_00215 [Candidatus Saccharibacteria bacterium]|nr:hypothetical protein [Candidatus Saccharibacteria bacterium]